MTDQMICSAFEVLPLPGAEERMWNKINDKLRERGKEGWVLYGKRRSPMPVLLTAALVVMALLAVLLSARSATKNTQPDPIPAISAGPVETVPPTETPEPTKTPEERQREQQQLEEEEALYESRLPNPHGHAHQWVWDSYNTIIATCVSPGYKYYTCSVCGLRIEREYWGEHRIRYINMCGNLYAPEGSHKKWCPVCGADLGIESCQWVADANGRECILCGARRLN